MNTLLTGGIVHTSESARQLDVLIADEKIAAVEPSIIPPDDCEIVDVRGKNLLPGFIDMHVHLDDKIGMYSLADTYETGSRVAIQNGITSIWSFITQQRNQSLSEAITIASRKAENNCWCDYGWHLTPTSFSDSDFNEMEFWIERGFHTFKFYTTYRDAGLYLDYKELTKIFLRLSKSVRRILIHCEDESVLRSMSPCSLDPANALGHALQRPEQAEIVAVSKLCEIAEETKAPIHIVHVSSPESARIVCDNKNRIDITCETAPHYFTLCDDQYRRDDGYRWLCSPPLRDIESMRRLRGLAVQSECFDVFATDHCPFLRSDKDRNRSDYLKVPNGIAGLGALPHFVATLFPNTEQRYSEMAKRLAENSARILGIYPRKGVIQKGSDADIVIVSNAKTERPIQSSLADVYETYPDVATNLSIDIVYQNGERVVTDGKVIEQKIPGGKCLCLTV